MCGILLGVVLSGCLVPQSVDLDVSRHTVPTIDLAALPPYFLTPMLPLYLQASDDITKQCHCHLQLSIPVIKDDDPTIDLEARWFIDYDLNGSPRTQQTVLRQDLAGSFDTNAQTRGPLNIDLDADQQLGQGTHVIEMVIAERQGFAPDSQQPSNRALQQGWDATVLKIVVAVNPSAPGVTQCDANTPSQSPPLVRVCPQ